MALSDILGGISNVGQGLGASLFPTDPSLNGMVDPSTAAAARNGALIKLGLGIMRAPYSMTGLGSGLLDAYSGSQDSFNGAMQSAFKNTVLRHAVDYEQEQRAHELKVQGQQDRENAAVTAQRILTGMKNASDPAAYLNLVQNTPDAQNAFTKLGIQPPYTGPLANPQNLQDFQSQLGAAAGVSAPAQAPIKLGAGEELVAPAGAPNAFQPIASNAPKPDLERFTRTTDDGKTQDYLLDKHTGKTDPVGAPYTSTAQQRLNITSGNLADWTPEALDQAAESLRLTGKLPSNLGKGSPVVPQLYAMAAAKAKAAGQDSTAAVFNQQAFHAGGMALSQLTKQQNTIGAFEATAEKNMDLALSLSDKVDRSGSPLINRAIMHWKQGITGDPDTASFVNALTAARTEYAKVLSGATGAAGISDAGRREAEELFSKVTSPEALKATIATAKQEMQNRMSSFTEQEARLKDSMTGAAPNSAAPAGAPTAPVGAPVTKTIDGVIYTKIGGHWYAPQ